MKYNWKEHNKENNLFKSYYCSTCKQTKPCYILSQEYCCACYYQIEQERSKEYSNYEKILTNKKREQKERFQQLQLLKNYQGCKQCGSKEIDAYFLYKNSKIICHPCRLAKEGGASGTISFSEQSKWYKKYWGINLGEMLENFSQLPTNKKCADQWKQDINHLKHCACLEEGTRKICLLFTKSLRENKKKLKDCQCKKSEKVRVSNDHYAWCEICEQSISVASKKRVIKNRNDPKFWGLEVKEKVLCGNCLESKKEGMPSLRKVEFNRYRKVGRL